MEQKNATNVLRVTGIIYKYLRIFIIAVSMAFNYVNVS